jgi:hypothetical protein
MFFAKSRPIVVTSMGWLLSMQISKPAVQHIATLVGTRAIHPIGFEPKLKVFCRAANGQLREVEKLPACNYSSLPTLILCINTAVPLFKSTY